MERILIVRLSSLGDIIHTLPAFAALRRAFPEAKIRWAVEEKGKEILDLVPGIDEIKVIGKRKWRRSVSGLKDREQTAVDFQGLVKSALLAFLSRSRRRLGFSRENLKEPLASVFYTERLSPIPEEEGHVVSKNLKLLQLLGLNEDRFDFPMEIPAEVGRSVRTKLEAAGWTEDKKIVVHNVGAAWATKRWFPEKWMEMLAKVRLSDSFPFLLWGNEEERRLAEAVATKTGVKIAPDMSIKEVIALLRLTSLLVSGDTFALQAACALDVPVVALFGPTNPRRNGPFRKRDKVVSAALACSPCYKHECPTLKCLHAISVEDVATAVEELWGTHD
jgi:lipopolysaccharide heptosyltransferase I